MKAQPKKHRSEHPAFDQVGSCTRCGCGKREERCPPGFWMTPDECRKWDGLSWDDRETFERMLSKRTTSAPIAKPEEPYVRPVR